MKSTIKAAALITILAAALTAVTGCNKKNDAALPETGDAGETIQQEQRGETVSAQTGGTAAGGYDYSKILKGDFSDFAGTWVNGKGDSIQLKADGSFRDDFRDRTFLFDKDSGTYLLSLGTGQDSFSMFLFPVGVDAYNDDGKLVKTDTTKIRLHSNNPRPSSNDVLYYRETSGTAEIGPPPDFGSWEPVGGKWQRTFKYEDILKGNLWDFMGVWKSGGGQEKWLSQGGTFADGQTAGGFARQNNPRQAAGGDFYMWGVQASEEGGFVVTLFPPGVDVMGANGIIPTDKTKVRLTMGQDLPSSGADVFQLEW